MMEKNNLPKLVRDCVPAIIAHQGLKVTYHAIKSNQEFKDRLKSKLIEEVFEFSNASERSHIIEELADIYEVLNAIKREFDIGDDELNDTMRDKRISNGAFGSGYILDNVEDSTHGA
jgi:predicted house-cleaning noncanonical NTP pyrophosphatase (MazG superfamily)